jgi:hypothetical protein
MIFLWVGHGMAKEIDVDLPAPTTTATYETVGGSQPDPMVIPYRDILAPYVGQLHDIEVLAEGDAYVWSGTDITGRRRTGAMRSDLGVGDDARSITLGWAVEVDE